MAPEQQQNQSKQIEAAAISAAKRDLLAKFLRGDVPPETSQTNTIPRRASDAPSQLSFSQERLWFLDQLMPGSPVFNVPIAVRISGELDVEVLQRAVSEIVKRHEVFRTAFITRDGLPAPEVSHDVSVTIEVIDLSATEPSESEGAAQRLAQKAALRPFDLSRAPLIRTSLIRLNDRESIFVLNMHHIVSDGSSILIFFNEVS